MKKNIHCLACGRQRKQSHENLCGTPNAYSPNCVVREKFDAKAYKAELKAMVKAKKELEESKIKEAMAKAKEEAEAKIKAKKEEDDKLLAENKIKEEKEAAEQAIKDAQAKAEKLIKKQATRDAMAKAKQEEEAKKIAEAELKTQQEKIATEVKVENQPPLVEEKIVAPEATVVEGVKA